MDNGFTGIGSEDSGNPTGDNGSGQAGAGTQVENQDAGRETGNLDWLKAKGWVNDDGSVKTDDVLKSYQELEQKTGKLVGVPDEHSKPEDVDAFYKRIGWPGEAKGYEFKKPEGLDPNTPYDEGFAGLAKEWANDEKLTAKQAQGLHDKWVAKAAEDAKAFWAGRDEAAKAAHGQFVKEWGAQGSDDYNRNVDAANRAMKDPKLAGLADELKQAGVLTPDGKFTSFAIGHLLATHGAALQNDSFVGNGNGGPSDNPFDKSSKAYSLTEQGRIIKAAPEQARTLARAAGWDENAIKQIGSR